MNIISLLVDAGKMTLFIIALFICGVLVIFQIELYLYPDLKIIY